MTAKPCGRIGLKAAFHWTRLTYFPHHPNGNPERYAMRQAMLVRLNQVEGLFNRLKAGKFLGNEGAARTRVLDDVALEGLFSLACLSMTASLVAEQRGALNATATPSTPAQPMVKATATRQPVAPAPFVAPLLSPIPSVARGTVVTVENIGVFKRGRRRIAA
jgi:hypothetical protein